MFESKLTTLYKAQDKEGRKIINKQYYKWLLNFPCVITSSTEIERHHLRSVQGLKGGMGLKPPDIVSIPLKYDYHKEIHSGGEKTFSDKYNVDLLEELKKLHNIFYKIVLEKSRG